MSENNHVEAVKKKQKKWKREFYIENAKGPHGHPVRILFWKNGEIHIKENRYKAYQLPAQVFVNRLFQNFTQQEMDFVGEI